MKNARMSYAVVIAALACGFHHGTYGQPQQAGAGNFPDIEADKAGNIHLVYGRSGLRYRRYNAAKGQWEAEQAPGCNCTDISRSDPDIVIDRNDRPHVFCGTEYAYWNGSGWIKVTPPNSTRDTELGIDSNDNVYLVKRGGNNGGYIGLLKLAESSSTWQALTDPDKGTLGRNDHVYPDIAISPVNNHIHIVYRHGTPMNTAYRVSSNGGQSWSASGVTDIEPESPHIVVDFNDGVYVTDGAGNFFKKSVNGWTGEGSVITAGSRMQPELAADRNNTIFVGCWGGKYNIRKNGQWIGEKTLSRVTGRSLTGFVEMAGMDNFAYIVWEEGSAGSADLGLTTNPVVVVGKLLYDGTITGLSADPTAAVRTGDRAKNGNEPELVSILSGLLVFKAVDALSPLSIEIYSVAGKRLFYSGSIRPSCDGYIRCGIHPAALPEGIYSVLIRRGENILIKKAAVIRGG